jgi:hypothetical protein
VKKILSIGILALGLASCNLTGVNTGLTILNPTTDSPACKVVGSDNILTLNFNYAGTIKKIKLSFSSKKADNTSNPTQSIEFDVTSALKPTGVNWLLNSSNTVKLELNLETISPANSSVTPMAITQPSPVTSYPMDIKIEAKDDKDNVSTPSALDVKGLNVASCYSAKL